MWNQGAVLRRAGVSDVSCHARTASVWPIRGVIGAAMLLMAGLFAGPAAAQSTAVNIVSASRPSFSRANQPLTFYVRLDAGNAVIKDVTFTSGSPTGMSPLSCAGMPADVNESRTCTFTYTTTEMDVAMGKVTALGRWRATRDGASRSGSTNTYVLPYAPPRQPDAPVVTSAIAGDGEATVSFSPPFDGGYPVDDYTVTSQPGNITASGTSGPITVTGLTNGVTYRFSVAARSTMGTSGGSSPSLDVTPKAAQSIDFDDPGALDFGTAPTLQATTTSGLAATFSSGTASVCTVTSGGTLTFVTAGSCTILADQAGDTVYAPATQVSRTFTVNAVAPGAPTIGTATAGDAQATVTFTAPASTGGIPLSGYTVTASPGGIQAPGGGSPIVVTGLTNGSAYTFTVTATNAVATGAPSADSNAVTPSSAPVVAYVAVPANGLYGPGDTLDFTVNWDQNVVVTGTPQLGLTIGAASVRADYVSGSGTSATTFRYTVLPGQVDANGITPANSLDPNGGTLRNVYGVDAATALAPMPGTAGVLVGSMNQAPVNTIPGPRNVTENDTLDFGNTVSIADADAGSAQVQVTLSATQGVLSLSGTTGLAFATGDGAGDATMTFLGTLANINAALNGLRFVPTPGYHGPATLQIETDDLGNTGFGGTQRDTDTIAITVVPLDSTPPEVASIVLGDASPTSASTVTYEVTFSEAVVNVDAGDFSLVTTGGVNAVVASLYTADNLHYVVTAGSVTGDGTLKLVLNGGSNIADAAGNRAPGYSTGPVYVMDGSAPMLSSVAISAPGQYVAGSVLNFIVRFDENVLVTGMPSLPFMLDGGGAREAAYVSGSGTDALTFAYTVATGDQDLDGPRAGAALALNGGTLVDSAGNVAAIALNNVGDLSGVVVGLFPQAITGFGSTPAAPAFAPDGSFAVTATGGASGLPVVFASTTASVCSVSGNTVTTLAAGTCSLTANQAGNANYAAATQATLNVTIGAGTQAIADFVANPAAPVYAPGGTFTLSATKGISTSPIVFASTTTSICTVSGDTVTMLSAGTCSLTADQAGDGNYDAAPQLTLDVAISAATQAITGFTANPDAPVYAPGGTFVLAAVGGASGNAVVFASTSPAVCTVAGNVVTMQAAGTCALTADQAGSNDYLAAPQVALQVVIGRATPTLSWVGEMSRVVGEAAFDLPDPGSDSRGAFTFASSNSAVATINGRRVTIVGAGVTTLIATQSADGNYAEASIETTLTVADRPDPTRDASVVDGLQAQVDASVRFAAAQLSNIQGRLREQRMATVNRSSNDLTFAMASRSGGSVSMSAQQFASMDTAHLPQGLAVWTAGAITTGGRDADARGSNSDFRSDGVTVGADWRFSDRAVFGIAGGWGWNDTDLDDARSRLDAQQRAISLYGLWRPTQRWFVDGIVGWGDLDFDIRRRSDVANATASATRGGEQAFGALTAGYEHGGGIGMTLTGYGRLDASRTTLDAYREQGLGIYDLSYGSQRVENSGASLGVEGSFPILTPRGSAFRPYWMLEYRQTLDERSDVELNYVVQPVDGGYVLGMRGYGDDALTYGGGIDMELARGWKLSLLGRRQHADGQRPSSTFGLLISFAPQAGSATATASDEGEAQALPQDAERPAQP